MSARDDERFPAAQGDQVRGVVIHEVVNISADRSAGDDVWLLAEQAKGSVHVGQEGRFVHLRLVADEGALDIEGRDLSAHRGFDGGQVSHHGLVLARRCPVVELIGSHDRIRVAESKIHDDQRIEGVRRQQIRPPSAAALRSKGRWREPSRVAMVVVGAEAVVGAIVVVVVGGRVVVALAVVVVSASVVGGSGSVIAGLVGAGSLGPALSVAAVTAPSSSLSPSSPPQPTTPSEQHAARTIRRAFIDNPTIQPRKRTVADGPSVSPRIRGHRAPVRVSRPPETASHRSGRVKAVLGARIPDALPRRRNAARRAAFSARPIHRSTSLVAYASAGQIEQ